MSAFTAKLPALTPKKFELLALLAETPAPFPKNIPLVVLPPIPPSGLTEYIVLPVTVIGNEELIAFCA